MQCKFNFKLLVLLMFMTSFRLKSKAVFHLSGAILWSLSDSSETDTESERSRCKLKPQIQRQGRG